MSFTVDRIKAARRSGAGVEYLVAWRGYADPSEDTWEPPSSFDAAPSTFAGYAAAFAALSKGKRKRAAAAAPAAPKRRTKAAAAAAPGAPRKAPKQAASDSEDEGGSSSDDEPSDYEKLRAANLKRNQAMLSSLNIQKLAAKPRPRSTAAPRARRPLRSPSRRSARTQGQAPKKYSDLDMLEDRKAFRADASRQGQVRRVSGREQGGRSALRRGVAVESYVQEEDEAISLEFAKSMTVSMVVYSFKFGIGQGHAVLNMPRFGTSSGGGGFNVWIEHDGKGWECAYRDHSKCFDGGWIFFATDLGLATGDVVTFTRRTDAIAGAATRSDGYVRLGTTIERVERAGVEPASSGDEDE